jgi:hypothetical protein
MAMELALVAGLRSARPADARRIATRTAEMSIARALAGLTSFVENHVASAVTR